VADETQPPAPTEIPAPTSSTSQTKGAATTATQDKQFPYERLLRESRAVSGYEQFIVAGAAAHHDWQPDTMLSISEFKSGVEAWLNSEMPRED
jgi:hypothetical protein